MAALVSFLSADAERYQTAQRHGGAHPDGEPVEAICQWAGEHADELDQLTLDLKQAVACEGDGAAEAPAEPDQAGSRL